MFFFLLVAKIKTWLALKHLKKYRIICLILKIMNNNNYEKVYSIRSKE